MGGWRIIRTLGMKVSQDPRSPQRFTAETSGAMIDGPAIIKITLVTFAIVLGLAAAYAAIVRGAFGAAPARAGAASSARPVALIAAGALVCGTALAVAGRALTIKP